VNLRQHVAAIVIRLIAPRFQANADLAIANRLARHSENMVFPFVVRQNNWMRRQRFMRFAQGRKVGDSIFVGTVSVCVDNEQPVLLTGQSN